MNFSIKLLFLSIIAPTFSMACIGQSVRVAIVGNGESTVIQRFVFNEPKEELLDDTGYIGAHVLIADIINSSKENTIDSEAQKTKLSALKERLNLLIKKLNAVLANKDFQSAEPKMFSNIEKSVSELKKLKEIIDHNPSKTDVEKIWKTIESKLNSNESKDTNIITAKYRSSGTKNWSANEDNLTEFKLPLINTSKALTRELGCENEMLEVNVINQLLRSTTDLEDVNPKNTDSSTVD